MLTDVPVRGRGREEGEEDLYVALSWAERESRPRSSLSVSSSMFIKCFPFKLATPWKARVAERRGEGGRDRRKE